MYIEHLNAALSQRYGTMEKEALFRAAGKLIGKGLGRLGARNAGAKAMHMGRNTQTGFNNMRQGIFAGWNRALNNPQTTSLVPYGTKIIPTRSYQLGEAARNLADDATQFALKHPQATGAMTGISTGALLNSLMHKTAE